MGGVTVYKQIKDNAIWCSVGELRYDSLHSSFVLIKLGFKYVFQICIYIFISQIFNFAVIHTNNNLLLARNPYKRVDNVQGYCIMDRLRYPFSHGNTRER